MEILGNINFSKLKEGLAKTRNGIVNRITETFTGKANIDENTLAELEEILITSDIGFETAEKIIEQTRATLVKDKDRSIENVKEIIKTELISILESSNKNNLEIDINKKPVVILVVGVNGSGKTTSVGKLAYNFKSAGLSVLIGSADTFRAAANDQLDIWAKRANVEIIESATKDPSAVAFDTVKEAINRKIDVVLIDTAGRLQNQKNLMEELGKIKRVISTIIPDAPNEIFLVLDGTAGQNAVYQADEFEKYTDITGLIITKLDGTAKGGVIFKICHDKKIPVRFIGVGEGIEDLQTFSPREYVEAIIN